MPRSSHTARLLARVLAIGTLLCLHSGICLADGVFGSTLPGVRATANVDLLTPVGWLYGVEQNSDPVTAVARNAGGFAPGPPSSYGSATLLTGFMSGQALGATIFTSEGYDANYRGDAEFSVDMREDITFLGGITQPIGATLYVIGANGIGTTGLGFDPPFSPVADLYVDVSVIDLTANRIVARYQRSASIITPNSSIENFAGEIPAGRIGHPLDFTISPTNRAFRVVAYISGLASNRGSTASYSHWLTMSPIPDGLVMASGSGYFLTSPIPEPSTFALFAGGLTFLALGQRVTARRRRQ